MSDQGDETDEERGRRLRREYARWYRANYPDRTREQARRSRAKNPERAREKARLHKRASRERAKQRTAATAVAET